MALNRGDMRAEVIANLGNRTDTNITTRVNRWLDLAQVTIARRHDWRELRTRDAVVIAFTGVKITDRFNTHGITALREFHSLIRQVGTDTAVKLIQIPPMQWDQIIGQGEDYDTSDPKFYTLSDLATIEWFPVPSRAFDLQRRYSKWPVDFPGDGSASELTNKDDMLIAQATHLGFQTLGMREDAASWFGVYKNMEQRALAQDILSPDLVLQSRGLATDDSRPGDPWTDPFVRRDL